MASDPILRAMVCPPEMMPSSAKGLLRDALSNGWEAHATLAIGPPDDAALAVMSVVVWCRKSEQLIRCRWECPADRSKPFGFSSGWKTPGMHPLGFREAQAAVRTIPSGSGPRIDP